MTPIPSQHNEPEGPPLAVAVMGPTASGKTELAVELAARFPCDIVSVDSAMVYRGLDIGTAKPSADVLATAPHRLIDICDPTESYSAARFRADCLREMSEISARGRIPLLVGGTMLYFRALEQGLSPLPEANPEVRARLDALAVELGPGGLHRRLAEVDADAAKRIHPNDPQRIQRALEVFEITGTPMTLMQQEARSGRSLPYRLLKVVRAPRERKVLHQRIELRFRRMLKAGFEEEVRQLWRRGDLRADMPSMRSVGYRQMLKYLFGEYSYGQMTAHSIAATRQLAKRQFTWLRKEKDCAWLLDGASPVEFACELLEAAAPAGLKA